MDNCPNSMTAGLLTSNVVAQSKLNAEWVVLCHTTLVDLGDASSPQIRISGIRRVDRRTRCSLDGIDCALQIGGPAELIATDRRADHGQKAALHCSKCLKEMGVDALE
jgi:hypothetical protein